ncbi:hypothetical protein MAR_005724 [Mya arenaria]|uniref:Uncharacterized protein n=1 Tax=Mya arenaria TaxID=6604 RepID=A0ABY7F495_MYAAR|nr:hypothetical protein MAR_005724 [Mya arenaria]
MEQVNRILMSEDVCCSPTYIRPKMAVPNGYYNTTDKRLRGQGRAIGRGEYSKRRSIDQIVQCEVTDRLLDGV